MLSILIPTRDFTCYKLVSDLQRQAQAENVDYEIIVAEDGSRDQVSIIANHKIEDLPFCRHIIMHENIGRARIRNFLAAQASYDTLLFIDSDARVEKDDFIKTYISAMGKAPVTVGGLYHPFANFNPHKSLRFLYETKADVHRSAEERRKNPYMSLSTFNLMMSREAFNMTGGFDPNCRQYGYEDALMGWRLEALGVEINHIDNPLLHTGIDTNREFIDKSEKALATLSDFGPEIIAKSRVGKAYMRIGRYGIDKLLVAAAPLLLPLLRHNLLSPKPSLGLFKVYKLMVFCKLIRAKKKQS